MEPKLPFTVRENPPTLVDVTTKDGTLRTLELRFALVEVWELTPEPPAGVAIGFQATVISSLKPREP